MESARKRHGRARPLAADEGAEAGDNNPCRCREHGLPQLAFLTSDPAEIAIVRLVRAFMAGYASGEIGFWDQALPIAEAAFGREIAPLLTGHALALVRAIRHERMTDFRFQGIACHGVSEDEADLVTLLQIARSQDEEGIALLAARFSRNPDAPGFRFAVAAVVDLICRVSGGASAAVEEFDAYLGAMTRH